MEFGYRMCNHYMLGHLAKRKFFTKLDLREECKLRKEMNGKWLLNVHWAASNSGCSL